MSFLKDKEWDKMDWLNRAVEPFTFSFNEHFAKIPSEYVFTYADAIAALKSDQEIRLHQVVSNLVLKSGLSKADLFIIDLVGIDWLFQLKLEPDTELDLDSETIKGRLAVVKTVEALNDDAIRELLPQMALNILHIDSSKVSANQINETMDILECKEARSSSSIRKKIVGLQTHVYEIYKDNSWNIRNVDLAIKMLSWIKSYCENGDRCSLANMSKLKCMIHNGHPIYSMEEIV
jgi:hypothetical protein